MAEIFDFYVADNRTIKFNPIEPILQEDNGVAVWRFRIPKVLNNIDMSGFAWWFVYINAAKQKYSEPLTLTADADDPDNYCIADYTIDYGISLTPGSFTFALEAINANGNGDIVEEWHTKTYSHSVIGTLQGNQAEYSETESDIISALMVQIQEKYNALVGGATPIPVASISAMTDTSKIYLLTTDNNWYCYNGSTWVSGGQYASGIVIDPTLTQSGQAADAKITGDRIDGKVSKPTPSPNGTAGQLLRTNGDGTTQWVDQGLPTDEQTAEAISEWMTDHPEATTTVQDGSLTYKKLVTGTLGFVTPEMFGAKGDGVTDDTQSINSMFSSGNTRFILDGVYLVSSSINLSGATGIEIIGSGTLKAKSGVTIPRLLDLSDSKNVRVGINIDMSQDASVTPNSEKCERGIYAKDAINLTLDSVEYYHCCVGRPFFIDGTSANDIDVSANGSKRIYIIDNKIYGTEYNVADEGCYPVIKSEFFANDDSTYISASNGIKRDDLTVDPDVTYPATTQHVYIRGLYAENCDRVALLNVSDCEITDFNLVNCYTRGFNLSPTCKNITIKNGTISGGDACPLATGQACENVVFDSINITPLRPVGQKTSMKATTGCKNIAFKNISGQGGYTSVLLVLSSDNILCENVVLEFNGNTTPMMFDIEDEDVTTPYPITNVTIKNCKIYGNAVMHLINRGGVEFDAIRLINSELHAVNGSFWQGTNVLLSGELHLENIKVVCTSNSALVVETQNIAYFKNVLGLRITPVEQLAVSAAATIHTFTGLYFRVPDNTIYKAGDTFRHPDVMLFCDGIPLFYNIDWFVGSAQISNFMANSIRLNSSSTVPVNSKLTLVRNS